MTLDSRIFAIQETPAFFDQIISIDFLEKELINHDGEKNVHLFT